MPIWFGVMTRRPARLERCWIVAAVAYGIGRAIIVGSTLGDHGVNPFVYLTIDVATSIPLGIATARLVGAIVDRDLVAARKWALRAAGAFIAPDAYIVVAGRDLPAIVYVVLGAIAAATLALSVRGIRLRVAARRVVDGTTVTPTAQPEFVKAA
jgi:hypothetical protein